MLQIIPHHPTQDSITAWCATFDSNASRPRGARIELFSESGQRVQMKRIADRSWVRPFPGFGQGWIARERFTGLKPGKAHRLELRYGPVESASAHFTTLPSRLSKTRPFVMSLGSCFFPEGDGGEVGRAYSLLYDRGTRAHLKLLVGDQVYLDGSPVVGGQRGAPLDARIFQRYREGWTAANQMLRRGGTLMLPDDHEFWNDFPFDSKFNTAIDNRPRFRRQWRQRATQGVTRIQLSPATHSLSVGRLSVFAIDTRRFRTRDRFARPVDFRALQTWLSNLEGPGVLVMAQPLLRPGPATERHVAHPAFREQYARLTRAIENCRHDLLVLAGDVHFGRIASVNFGTHRMIEVISSPLSNMAGPIAGPALTSADDRPRRFPVRRPRRQQHEVEVHRKVSSVPRGAGYPARRTREHFMTLSFRAAPERHVALTVEAWRVRDIRNALPVREFTWSTRLR